MDECQQGEISKKCAVCKVYKLKSLFHKNNRRIDKLSDTCKECQKEYYLLNKDVILKRRMERYSNNKDKELQSFKEYKNKNKYLISEKAKLDRINNPEKYRNYYLKNKSKNNYYKNNPAKVNAVNAKRRAYKLQATPKWLTEQQIDHILQFYKASRELTLFYGCRFAVDHIEPLRGKTTCGLHVPWNLQILTFSENSKKHNKLIN